MATTASEQPRFHPFLTVLAWIVLALTLLIFGLSNLLSKPLAALDFPERSLNRMASRSLELLDARAQTPKWEQAIYDFYDGYLTTEQETDEVLQWNEEMADFSKEPAVQIELAILKGETGREKDLTDDLNRWRKDSPPLPLFAPILRAAYGKAPIPGSFPALRKLIDEVVPAGWSHDRLLIRLAEKAGDKISAQNLSASLQQQSQKSFKKYQALALLDVLLTLLFGTALFLFLKNGKSENWRVGTAPIPPPWRGWTGVTVLVRGAAIGSLVGFISILFPNADRSVVETITYVLCSLPIILLAKKHLFSPNHLTLREGLGLTLIKNPSARLLLVILAGMGLDVAGGWVINTLSIFVNLPSHWTESFDGTLVCGTRFAMGMGLLGGVIIAPLFEEVIFRGLVFGTLRRKFSWRVSALISAGIFAALHGYGAMGFLMVFWSGFVWAWMYEKSGSLLPGMIGHSLNNILFAGTQILLLRLS